MSQLGYKLFYIFYSNKDREVFKKKFGEVPKETKFVLKYGVKLIPVRNELDLNKIVGINVLFKSQLKKLLNEVS